MKTDRRPPHGAIPAEAILDPAMTTLLFRVLLFVAFHDRLSTMPGAGNETGKGCFSGRQRMRALVDCDNTSLSHALTKLQELGYIVAERDPDDGRERIYRVIYPDWESWQAKAEPRLAHARSLASGTNELRRPRKRSLASGTNETAEIVGLQPKVVGLETEIVGLDPEKKHGHSEGSSTQYYEDYPEDDSPQGDEYNSAQAARLTPRRAGNQPIENDCARVAEIDRARKGGSSPGWQLQGWLDEIESIADSREYGDATYHAARRVADAIADELSDRAAARAGAAR